VNVDFGVLLYFIRVSATKIAIFIQLLGRIVKFEFLDALSH